MSKQKIKKVLNKEKQIQQQYIEGKNINLNYSYSDLLLENFTPQQAQQDVITLSKCYCCPRHQINKPTTINDKYTYPINRHNLHIQDKCALHNCNCTCRHLSRFLCRIHNQN